MRPNATRWLNASAALLTLAGAFQLFLLLTGEI
jgi:hypothetical protein